MTYQNDQNPSPDEDFHPNAEQATHEDDSQSEFYEDDGAPQVEVELH